MASASCEKRPIAVYAIGLGPAVSVEPDAGTSKMYPWGFVRSPSPTPSVVSSHVNHDPHGVVPPAQFRTVPLMLDQELRRRPRFVSNSSVVVPPPAWGSWARFGAKASGPSPTS